MLRAKQAVPKLTSSTSRSCVFMVSSSRGFSAYNSFLSSFCFLHDRKVGRLGKDVHDSSGDDCSEGDQAKNGCWVVSHRKALSTYVMNLSGFVTKRKPPGSSVPFVLQLRWTFAFLEGHKESKLVRTVSVRSGNKATLPATSRETLPMARFLCT